MLNFKSIFQRSQNVDKKEVPNDKYYIALDTGTEMLKGLLFSTSDLGVDILQTYSIPQQIHAMRSGAIMNIESLINNSRLVIEKLTEKLSEGDKPKRLVLGMAGELVNGIAIAVDYNREKKETTTITTQEAQAIKDAVYQEIIHKGKQELAERLHTTIENVSILHVSFTGFMVEGVTVSSLVGQQGNKLKIYLYASFAPKQYVEEIQKIGTALNLEVACIVTQPFAVARSFHSAGEAKFSAIFIDIGGGTSDVALVTKGSNIDTQMFAFGGRAFTKRISIALGIDFRYAEQRKLKYSAGELSADVRDEIRRTLSTDAKLWVEAFKLALDEMDEIEQFPGQIYMCGGGSLLPDIKMALIEYPWTRNLNFAEFPKIKLITPDMLDKVYDKSGTLVNPYDVTPTALARFYWEVLAEPGNHYLHINHKDGT